MKVLHLISGGDSGGAKTHIFSLMKGLKGKVDAKIICFIKDTFYDEAVERGIDIEVYPQKSRSDMSVVTKLSDEIKKNRYDIVHCHGARANFIGMFLKKHISIPMVTTVHSDYQLDFKGNFYKNLIYTTLNKIALKKFDYYVCVTDSFQKMLEERGFSPSEIYVLYNGIDFEEENSVLSKEDFFQRYQIPYHGEMVVGIAARLDKVKDHVTFVKGAAYALEKTSDMIFLFAGDGEEKNRLEALIREYEIENHMYFLGWVKDKYSFFHAIDVNVLTSLSESFPYVILEAASCHKPTVASKTGGISHIISSGENGYLFPVGDAKSLGSHLVTLYNNRDLCTEFGERIYEKVAMNFSAEAMGNTQASIYQDILNREGKNENN